MSEENVRRALELAFQHGADAGLEHARRSRIAGADPALVGADDGNGLSSAGQFILNPKNSTFRPIQILQPNDTELSADVFVFTDFISPTVSGTVALTNTAQGVGGSDAITPAEFAAALPVVTAAAVQPSWLGSDYRQYKLDLVYLLANPAKLEGVNIASSETGTAPLLNSMQITMVTETPFGKLTDNVQTVSTFQQTTDFQAAKTTVPMDFPLDLLHYLNFSTVTNGSGGTVSFVCGFSASKRYEPFRKIWNGQDGEHGGPSLNLNRAL